LVLWVAFTVSFALFQAIPGDALAVKLTDPSLGLSPEQAALLRQRYGLDAPILIQYVNSLWGFLHGDLGYSIANGVPVAQRLANALPNTIALALPGLALAVVLGVGVATSAHLAPKGPAATALRALPPLAASLPVFWIGAVLLQVVAFQLRLVPAIGAQGPARMILPVITLAIPISAPIAQVLLERLDKLALEPFAQAARAKGGSRWWVVRRHLAKAAAPAGLTIAAVTLGELVAGSVVTETVFSLGGLGRLVEGAMTTQDLPVIQAIVVLVAAVYVVVNLAVDLALPWLDRRVAR
jgi:peptide/nickel transport system permease protein